MQEWFKYQCETNQGDSLGNAFLITLIYIAGAGMNRQAVIPSNLTKKPFPSQKTNSNRQKKSALKSSHIGLRLFIHPEMGDDEKDANYIKDHQTKDY